MKLATFFLGCVLSTLVLAQDNVPIYVPFEWDQEPLTATVLGSQSGTTTYNLVDQDPMTMTRVVGGPATVVQGPGRSATMFYANPGGPTPTLSGICELASPIAICTLNVYSSGAPLPTGSKPGVNVGSQPGEANSGSSTGVMVISATTVALGFVVGLGLLR